MKETVAYHTARSCAKSAFAVGVEKSGSLAFRFKVSDADFGADGYLKLTPPSLDLASRISVTGLSQEECRLISDDCRRISGNIAHPWTIF